LSGKIDGRGEASELRQGVAEGPVKKSCLAVGGIGLGAALMYLADPDEGRRRRARLRDLAVHFSRTAASVASGVSRDVQHRLGGAAARTLGHLIVPDVTPDDDVLAARVRARLGRLVSHPHAVKVLVSDGNVTLSGPVFDVEVSPLLAGIARVAGVVSVDNHLEAHADAVHVSALQGPGPRQRTWVQTFAHAVAHRS
jgi:hypothetical protein